MPQQYSVIIVPGLGDRVEPTKWATNHWTKYNLTPIVHSVGWRGQACPPKLQRRRGSFQEKLASLLKLIDRELALAHRVSLVGCSAGGSMAMNAYIARKKSIHRVVNVCGRLRVGETTGIRAFALHADPFPAFAESVRQCEGNLPKLSTADHRKIMTIRPIYDEVVPPDTVTVPGADNLIIPSLEHSLSIALSLTLFSSKITTFLVSSE